MDDKLSFVALIFTALFGLLAMLKPNFIFKIASLKPKGQAGISEIRAVYGGWVFGLACYALWCQSIDVYYCIGFGWLGAAILRVISIFIDKSYSPKNLRIVGCELFFSVLLLIKF